MTTMDRPRSSAGIRPGLLIPEIENDLTRRDFLTGAGSLLVLGAAGCGGETAGDESPEGRVIRHELGETRVPENPERLLVLDLSLLDMALALGVVPAGASPIFPTEREPGPFVSYLGEEVEGVEVVGEPGQPNLETVANFGPDLIVGSSFLMEEVYDQLSEVAPTVAMDTFNSARWKETTFPLLGETLGRSEEVGEVLSRYEERVEEVRSVVGDPEEIEASSVSAYDDRLTINGTAHPGCLVLEDVGFSRPEAQRFELSEDDLTSAAISEERIPDMDGDAIFVGSVSDAALENLRDNPLWQRLEAVREGRVYEVGQEAWIFPGPSAANSVLDDIEKSLA